MTPARQYGLAVALLVLAAAGALGALGQVWVTATAGAPGLPALTDEFTGRELLPAAAGTAVLLLAGVAGIVATRGRGRQAVGVLLFAAAGGLGGLTLKFGLGLPDSAEALVATAAGVSQARVVTNSWWLFAAGAGVVAAAVSLAVILVGARWPVLTTRYERGRLSRPAAAGTPAAMTPAQAWDALDRGEDPTTAAEVTE